MAIVEAGEATRQVTDLLRTRTRAAARDQEAGARPNASDRNASDRNASDTDPAGLISPAALEDVLRKRESVRDFAPRELKAEHVTDLICRGYAAERQVWPARAHGDARLVVLLAAYRVTGMTPNMYAVPAGDQRPSPVPGQLPLAATYADAPALLLICADPHQQARDPSGSGYGSLLVRAGTLGYAMWLAAVSSGLAGSVYGGSCDDVTIAARGWDKRYRHFFTVAIGIAVAGTE